MRAVLIRSAAAAAIAAAAVSVPCRFAHADAATSITAGGAITVTTGAEIYQHVCQGCHMPGGAGAVGAAAFPALAGNRKLAGAPYPIYVILNGYGAMPWFNGVLSDTQIANVVAYIRTHFGNSYAGPVRPADVAALRGPAPTPER